VRPLNWRKFRQPPPCGDLPRPQWAIAVPPPPRVVYRAETPEPDNRLPETPDAFQDADEDLCPLTGSWVEIMDQEMRDGTAVTSMALLVIWASDAPIVAPPVPSTVTATAAQGVPIPTPQLDLAGERPVSPTIIASTPGASQPDSVTTSMAPVASAATSLTVASASTATASTSQMDTHPVLRY